MRGADIRGDPLVEEDEGERSDEQRAADDAQAANTHDGDGDGDGQDAAAPATARATALSPPPTSATRPGPSVLTPKIPAAGAGTRTGPRPVPRSSSALRHVSSGGSSSRTRVATFAALPEDGPPAATTTSRRGTNDTGSIVQRQIDADARRKKRLIQQEDYWPVESSDADDGGDEQGDEQEPDQGDNESDNALRKPLLVVPSQKPAKGKSRQAQDATDYTTAEDDDDDDDNHNDTEVQRSNSQAPRRAKWHPHSRPGHHHHLPSSYSTASGLQTPGVNYPAALNTPLEGSPNASSPEFEPRHRLEWQTMLESVLASEVLQSETKRITSVDAPDLSKTELMYRRWLDIRASLRGRGHFQGAVEAEEKRLKSGWPEMLKVVIRDIKAFRDSGNDVDDADSGNDVDDGADTTTDTPHTVFTQLDELLTRVDSAESQFPSLRKAVEMVPEWGDAALQAKLDALRAWHTVSNLLRQRLLRLQEWTGSETLQIDIPQQQHTRNDDDATSLFAKANGETEGLTFVERILKEDSFKSTFESRTLSSLTQVVCKARDTIKAYHSHFVRMQMPSFDAEITQLISFPLRLMESALELRLDYAGKIKEPSPLIVDSLTDDVRSALAMALRTKQNYQSIIVPDPDKGWDLPPAIASTYEETLRHALRFFFRLISFKLKGSVFFKETEILDNEWQFLSQAIAVIEGGDVIVAKRMTKIVNELFARIVSYFERELAAPSTTRGKSNSNLALTAASQASSEGIGARGPSIAGGLTKGLVHLTLTEKVKWIHAVFDNVRIRSRKLLGFAREVRNRLDNAAEYDLASLRPPPPTDLDSEDTGNKSHDAAHAPSSTSSTSQGMDLNAFMQTLINADYFLVYTESYEERGIYIIAEPSLHDKPEVIQELLGKCMMQVSLKESLPTQADPIAGQPVAAVAAAAAEDAGGDGGAPTTAADQDETPAPAATQDDVPPKYLLLLTPRDPFMWTGRVMTHKIDPVEVALGERRLRLIADGPKERLQRCKEHFYSVFATGKSEPEPVKGRRRNKAAVTVPPSATANHADEGRTSAPTGFPLDVVNEHMAHMADVQAELRSINKGVYMLSNAILAAVPSVRRSMRRRKSEGGGGGGGGGAAGHQHQSSNPDEGPKLGSETDELIQNCFSMATEQGFRSLPFIESARLRGYMTLSLARLAIDWVGFICDDCVPTDRKTFKWAVAALENAVAVTRDENIFHLNEDDFNLMRAKVASCMALLISHFDILGARSSVAKAKEEQDRLEREKAERNRAVEAGLSAEAVERLGAAAHKMVEGTGGVGAPPMLNRADSGMQAIEERWVQKMMEWDEARHNIDSEQRLIGRVLDDTRLEDQGLQFLASSSSRIQIRWQQGRFIGSGTFGTVYLAVNMDSGGLMAVKEIRFADISNNTSLYKNIKDEMNVMEMLHHPNIVDYYGIEVHRDKVYIFEEYCQGGSLAQLLEHGRIEDEAVIQVYTLQMLDGLVYLHSQGVVHRDIKPDNILLDHQGVIKFVDFGAAKVLAKNSRTVQKSRRGFTPGGGGNMAGMVGPDGKPVGAAAVQSLQGTPMYMSPEVIKGESRGRRGAMDVWSLGCVVLEFATGRRPWSQLDNEWAIMFHIGMAQQHPPLPEPGQLSELGIDFIRQCLNIDPYERPSAAEMRDHPWIQELVDQIEAAANEEEAAASAMDGTTATASTTPSQEFFSGGVGTSNSLSIPSSSSAQTSWSGGTGAQQQGTPSLKHGNSAATGVAAMAFTPGTRSISTYIQSRAE